MQLNDVRVISEGLQEHDLSEGPLGVGLVPEGVENFLHRYRLSGLLINRFPDDPVCAFAQSLLDVESLHDVIIDLGHFINDLVLRFLWHF